MARPFLGAATVYSNRIAARNSWADVDMRWLLRTPSLGTKRLAVEPYQQELGLGRWIGRWSLFLGTDKRTFLVLAARDNVLLLDKL